MSRCSTSPSDQEPVRMKMKVALGPMEMMTDSLRLSEGVPEPMKKGETR